MLCGRTLNVAGRDLPSRRTDMDSVYEKKEEREEKNKKKKELVEGIKSTDE